jgi:hypothetical protein
VNTQQALELEADVERIKREIEIAQGRAYSRTIDSKQADLILANLKLLKINNDFRRQVREWVVAHVEKMVFDGIKQQFAIQFKKGAAVLYQFKNKYSEGEVMFFSRRSRNIQNPVQKTIPVSDHPKQPTQSNSPPQPAPATQPDSPIDASKE